MTDGVMQHTGMFRRRLFTPVPGSSDSPECSAEPSKVSAGTTECHILVLNDVKTVKALPSLESSGGEGRDTAIQGRVVSKS